jgi:general secretion pathway protein G
MNKKGFTLIELLVVIAIIGLLSTLAVVALNSARQKSRDSKRVADIKQIQTALELYFADAGYYPQTNSSEMGVIGTSLCSTGWVNTGCGTGTTYMGLVPKAPTPADCAVAADNTYIYTQTGSTAGAGYTITFCLGGKVGDLVSGNHTASPNGIQ